MSKNETTGSTIQERAAEALKEFPLPSQSASIEDNYRRILDWLYRGGRCSPAALFIDLGFGDQPDGE